MENAFAITKEGFDRLHSLSEKYAFSYKIFVLYSEPEIRQKRHAELYAQLQEIAPSKLISLGEVFEKNTAAQYFPSVHEALVADTNALLRPNHVFDASNLGVVPGNVHRDSRTKRRHDEDLRVASGVLRVEGKIGIRV